MGMQEVHDRQAHIKALLAEHHITFSDCVEAFRANKEELPYAEFARQALAFDDDMEVGTPPVVSETDNGCWVMSWFLVEDSDLWTGPTDTDGEPCRVINHYACTDCSLSWNDQWSCACNDRCPGCNLEIDPHESTYLDIEGNPEK